MAEALASMARSVIATLVTISHHYHYGFLKLASLLAPLSSSMAEALSLSGCQSLSSLTFSLNGGRWWLY